MNTQPASRPWKSVSAARGIPLGFPRQDRLKLAPKCAVWKLWGLLEVTRCCWYRDSKEERWNDSWQKEALRSETVKMVLKSKHEEQSVRASPCPKKSARPLQKWLKSKYGSCNGGVWLFLFINGRKRLNYLCLSFKVLMSNWGELKPWDLILPSSVRAVGLKMLCLCAFRKCVFIFCSIQ